MHPRWLHEQLSSSRAAWRREICLRSHVRAKDDSPLEQYARPGNLALLSARDAGRNERSINEERRDGELCAPLPRKVARIPLSEVAIRCGTGTPPDGVAYVRGRTCELWVVHAFMMRRREALDGNSPAKVILDNPWDVRRLIELVARDLPSEHDALRQCVEAARGGPIPCCRSARRLSYPPGQQQDVGALCFSRKHWFSCAANTTRTTSSVNGKDRTMPIQNIAGTRCVAAGNAAADPSPNTHWKTLARPRKSI